MPIKIALVVDDSRSARFSLKKLLQKQDIQVDFAESAGDALNYLESNSPDVIFMDHLMPGMDGFEATKAIKGNPDTKDIPIIMCTSKEGSDYAEQAMSHGAMAILPKPAPAATLTSLLNQLQGEAEAASPAAGGEPEASSSTNTSGNFSPRALESLVKTTLDSQLGSIRKSNEELIEKRIDDKLEGATVSLRETLKSDAMRGIEGNLNDTIAKSSKSTFDELFDARLADVKAEILAEVSKMLPDAGAAGSEIAPELLEEVKNVAQFTAAHTAGDLAKESAETASRQIAQDVAQSEVEALKTEMMNELQAQKDAKSGDSAGGSGKVFGILGLLSGIGALVMHFV